jgi:hypothetical protein
MLGPIGANVMRILRVLTPHDLTRLTELASHKKEKKVAASQNTELKLDNKALEGQQQSGKEQAKENEGKNPKVIPLFKDAEQSQEEEVVYKRVVGESFVEGQNLEKIEEEVKAKVLAKQSKNKNAKESRLESLGVLSKEALQEIEEEKEKKIKEKKPTSTVFLLTQRDKLRHSNHKIFGQTAVKSYKVSASLDVKVEEKLEEEGKANFTSGILLDKKQF